MIARNDKRNLDDWGFGIMWPQERAANVQLPCFECGEKTTGRHHVVPKARGGTKQLPLCPKCHNTTHDSHVIHPELIKLGLQKARERGVYGAALLRQRAQAPQVRILHLPLEYCSAS